jgi:type I restriction enzyme S subunit
LLRARPAQVAGLSIPLPSLPEQRRIADILDKADAIRRKRHEAVSLAGDFLPSLFAKMFGPSGNKYAAEPLNDHLRFITSGSRGWAEHYVSVGKRFIRSLDVQMNRIGSDDVVFVNPPTGTEADRTRVQDGDVLVTITGSRIGRVAYVPDEFGEAYVSQHVSIVRLASTLRPRYCSMFLSLADGGQRQIAKAQYGQTKPGLSLSNIREFQIPIPPVVEQDRFIDIWTRHEDLAARVGQVSRESDDLFNSLVQRAFRGEL